MNVDAARQCVWMEIDVLAMTYFDLATARNLGERIYAYRVCTHRAQRVAAKKARERGLPGAPCFACGCPAYCPHWTVHAAIVERRNLAPKRTND